MFIVPDTSLILCPLDGQSSKYIDVYTHNIHISISPFIQGFPDNSVLKNPRDFRRPEFSLWVGKTPLEGGMATCSSIPAWEIPWTEEPGSVKPMGSQRVGHDWTTEHAHLYSVYMYINRQVARQTEIDIEPWVHNSTPVLTQHHRLIMASFLYICNSPGSHLGPHHSSKYLLFAPSPCIYPFLADSHTPPDHKKRVIGFGPTRSLQVKFLSLIPQDILDKGSVLHNSAYIAEIFCWQSLVQQGSLKKI